MFASLTSSFISSNVQNTQSHRTQRQNMTRNIFAGLLSAFISPIVKKWVIVLTLGNFICTQSYTVDAKTAAFA